MHQQRQKGKGREEYQTRNLANDYIPAQILETIIRSENPVESAQFINKYGEEIGKKLSRGLTATQLRNIFEQVRRIEKSLDMQSERAERELLLLIPKMQYLARRHYEQNINKSKEVRYALKGLVDVLSNAIRLIESRPQFQNFIDFCEAILAYHKVYEGTTQTGGNHG